MFKSKKILKYVLLGIVIILGVYSSISVKYEIPTLALYKIHNEKGWLYCEGSSIEMLCSVENTHQITKSSRSVGLREGVSGVCKVELCLGTVKQYRGDFFPY